MTTDAIPDQVDVPAASGGCPYHHAIGAAYQPLDPAHVADPHRFHARARHQAPVFFSPALNCWVVTRYDDVNAALRDHQRFSSARSSEVGRFGRPVWAPGQLHTEFRAPHPLH